MSMPSLYGKLTDVYTAATKPTSLVVGQVFVDWQTGKEYKFVLAGGSIPVNAALKPNEAVSGEMIATAAATDAFEGVNIAGAIVPDESYFWMQTKGDCTPLVAASQSAGDLLAPSATGGTLTVASAAAVQNIKAVLLADSGAGGATATRLL